MSDLYPKEIRDLTFRVEMLDGFVSKGELLTESFSISKMCIRDRYRISAIIQLESTRKDSGPVWGCSRNYKKNDAIL